MQTLFAALLSLGVLSEPGGTDWKRQVHSIRQAAATCLSPDPHTIAADEGADSVDPQRSGGDALPPALDLVAQAAEPSGETHISFVPFLLPTRAARAHPATGPPLV